MSPWLSADEAAAYLRLGSRKALYQRVRRGQIPAHRFGRTLRFRRDELDRAGVAFPTIATNLLARTMKD